MMSEWDEEPSLLEPEITMSEGNGSHHNDNQSCSLRPALPPLPTLKFVGNKKKSNRNNNNLFYANLPNNLSDGLNNGFPNGIGARDFNGLRASPINLPLFSSPFVPSVPHRHPLLTPPQSLLFSNGSPHFPNGFSNGHFMQLKQAPRNSSAIPPLITLNKKSKSKRAKNGYKTSNKIEEHEVVEIDDDEIAEHVRDNGQKEGDPNNVYNRSKVDIASSKGSQDNSALVPGREEDLMSMSEMSESTNSALKLQNRSTSSSLDDDEDAFGDRKAEILKARKLFRPRITVKLKTPQKHKKVKRKKSKSLNGDGEKIEKISKKSVEVDNDIVVNELSKPVKKRIVESTNEEGKQTDNQTKLSVKISCSVSRESSSISSPVLDSSAVAKGEEKRCLPKAKKSFNRSAVSGLNIVNITSCSPTSKNDNVKRRLSLSDVIQNQKRVRTDQKGSSIVASNIIKLHQKVKSNDLKVQNVPVSNESNSANKVARISSVSKDDADVASIQPSTEYTPKIESISTEYILPNGKRLGSDGILSALQIHELQKVIEAALDKQTSHGRSTTRSMYVPARNGDNVRLLQQLQLGSNVDQRFSECDNGTALHVAASNNHVLTAHILLQCGAEINSCDQSQNSSLMLASISNQWQMVNYLLNAGADACLRGEDGMTALHLAAREGSTECCHALLSHAATPKKLLNWRDEGGWTPLVWACENKRDETIKFLIDRGADALLTDNEGNNALHWTALSGSLFGCQLLISAGCDVNTVNNKGDTPLHISLRRDNDESSALFLMRNADIEAHNEDGISAEDCAINSSEGGKVLVRLRSLLKRQRSAKRKRERILSTDISKGKEKRAVECINEEDNAALPAGYVYVKSHCFASQLHVDRDMSKLIHCDCDDDICSSEAKCRCSDNSVRTWYDSRGRLIEIFNYSQPPTIFECNDMCSCHVDKCHNRVVQYGIDTRLQVFRTKNMGWGVRPLDPIPKGTFVCEYAGEIIPDQEAETREDSYLFDIETREDVTFCIDANAYGNVSRFINHSCSPNLTCVKVFTYHQDVSFPHIAFFANRDIDRHEELGYDYGDRFWVIKHTQFTCHCGSDSCKYNEANIKAFLRDFEKTHGSHDTTRQSLLRHDGVKPSNRGK